MNNKALKTLNYRRYEEERSFDRVFGVHLASAQGV